VTQRPTTGLLTLHASIVLLSVNALFAKLIALPATEIIMARSVFAAIALAVLLRWGRRALGLSGRRDRVVAMVTGVLLAVHWVTFFHSIQVSTVAVAVVTLHTFPVITVFLEPALHGSRPKGRDVLSALAVLTGIYLLVPEFSLHNAATQGVAWGLLSAFLYASRNVLHRRWLTHQPAPRALMHQVAVAALVLLPFAAPGLGAVTGWQWLQLLLLGAVFTAVPHTLFAQSMKFFAAKTVGVVACLQVVYAAAFAALILGEVPAPATIVGGLIVFAAAVVESASAARGARP
jgi:drug/metabolite transporter (DMT)-like permease